MVMNLALLTFMESISSARDVHVHYENFWSTSVSNAGALILVKSPLPNFKAAQNRSCLSCACLSYFELLAISTIFTATFFYSFSVSKANTRHLSSELIVEMAITALYQKKTN